MTLNGNRRSRVLLWAAGSAFGVLALGGLVGLWWWWGVGFDEAERLGTATAATDAAMVASFWVAVVGLVGLALTGVVAAVLHRRSIS